MTTPATPLWAFRYRICAGWGAGAAAVAGGGLPAVLLSAGVFLLGAALAAIAFAAIPLLLVQIPPPFPLLLSAKPS